MKSLIWTNKFTPNYAVLFDSTHPQLVAIALEVNHLSLVQPTCQHDAAFPACAYEQFLNTKRFSSLNGIRCVCCLAVIKEHVQLRIPAPRLADLGWLGVDMFFAISGFLIVTLLIRERERNGYVNLQAFYMRRTLRIFPIYYLMIFAVLAVFAAISPWRPNGLQYYAWTFPVLLTYTQDIIVVRLGTFFHCWSLAMEEQFYLFWPTVEKYAGSAFRWWILGGMLLVNQGVNFGFFDSLIVRVYGDEKYLKMPIFLITFTPILLGVSLAYLLNCRATFELIYRVVGHRWSPIILLGLLFAVVEMSPASLQGAPRLAIHTILALLLGSLVVRQDNIFRPLLEFAPIARLGVISYGLYLYHTFVIESLTLALKRIGVSGPNPMLMFFLTVAVTAAIAEGSFYLIEAPLLRIKERFSHAGPPTEP